MNKEFNSLFDFDDILRYTVSMDELIGLFEDKTLDRPEPFVKWAGGKTQLLDRIIPRMPKQYNRYYEPFIGGGSLFFATDHNVAIINDINSELINLYIQIRDNCSSVIEKLDILDKKIVNGKKDFYYEARDAFNQKITNKEYDIEMASLFIFINKHCFNGLYRVNGKGLFNVPYNNGVGRSFDAKNLGLVSAFLKQTIILNGDFEDACKDASEGDFLFFDSPYVPLKPDSFEDYTKEGFSLENHIRLANLYKELTEKGCFCMLTNHNTPLVNDLYKDFKIEVVPVKRFINSDATNRKGEEVIITNYLK